MNLTARIGLPLTSTSGYDDCRRWRVKPLLQDYERVEQAILFIEKNFLRQPSLADVAGAVGLSEHHFQRLFKRWAGISPKRFLQYVTAVHAKGLLKKQEGSLLDVAHDSGLSGVSRLHDLIINMEAMTPGEFQKRGASLIIRYGFHPSPFGECLIAVTDKGICSFDFVVDGDRDAALAEIQKQWKNAQFVQSQKATAGFIEKLCDGSFGDHAVSLHVKGTNFQIKVWEALLRIPAGEVTSYEEVAASIGKPKAVRAVANAVAHNPVALLIPCHRVIRKTGALGGYHYGTARKTAILLWESAGD
jgi:AraC family transcriptional regulator of adaptative response/methylated-DNA-[protein]-cysteine methyltransferase